MFRRRSNSHQDHESNEVYAESKVEELKRAIGPLSGRNLKYCTDACLKRYMKARNWNVEKSKKMLEDTLNWRSTYKPEEIRWHEVAAVGETGYMYRANFHDKQGRTVLISRPGLQKTSKSVETQIKHAVYLFENVMHNLQPGQEQMTVLMEFTGWSLTCVPVKLARELIFILQNHYPERLAVAFLYNPPRIFEAFWKIIKYFMDAKTFEKIKFVYPKNKDSVELMKSYLDDENLPKEFGGKGIILKYNHEEFSRLMVQDDLKSAAFWGSEAQVAPYLDCNGATSI
ncbi:hypothetical protein PIB30_008605 [Stylosanthes scabra]|uniref:CRAL-TRIO domain-containing protein n=1 Tax=Stylosanthes scabra TaxID=79078 RepID=A0ABU6R5E2_9FABA|nr:hypothetical protein [Stylosanthes scabra]